VTITAPAEQELDPLCPTRGFVLSSAANRRGFEYTLGSSSGRSNPVFLATTSDPIVLEHEPNDDPAHAQTVEAPCEISGVFGAPNDLDLYRFRAKQGDVYRIVASAERIGSPADPLLVLQKINERGDPTELTSGDDITTTADPVRFHTGTVDAEARMKVPSDGLYQVVMSDLYGSQRGESRLVYRLSIRRERPDFRLILVPDSADQPDALTLHAGGRAMAYVLAIREDGFNGPIRVEAKDLPAGVRCQPVVIPAGQTSAPIVFEADEKAAGAMGVVVLVGRARFGDRKEGLSYVAGASRFGPDLTRTVLGGGMIWPPPPPPPGRDKTTIAPARLTRGIALKVVDPAALVLSARLVSRSVTPGGLVAVELTAARHAGFTEAVTVTPVSPLTGQGALSPLTIPKTATSATFYFTAPRSVEPGEYTMVFQGTGPYPFTKDPKAKQKPTVNLNEPSNPVSFVVRPAPVTVRISFPKGDKLKPGASLPIEFNVTRSPKVSGPVDLSLVSPAGLILSAAPSHVASGSKAVLLATAAAGSPLGSAIGVVARATVMVRGEPVDVDVPLSLTIAK
jgi:hypothetical protein